MSYETKSILQIKSNVFENPVALSEFSKKEKILKIAPNPMLDELQFFMEHTENEHFTIELINVFGEPIFNKNSLLNNGWNVLNLGEMNVANGTYFLQISTKNERRIGKVVVAK